MAPPALEETSARSLSQDQPGSREAPGFLLPDTATTTLRVVRREGPGAGLERRRQRTLVAISIAILAASLFGAVASHAMVDAEQVRLDGVQAKITQAEELHQQLEEKVVELSSPSMVVSEARSQYHMTIPQHIIYLSPVQLGTVVKGGARGSSSSSRVAHLRSAP
ncbi:MAG: hypothetical protein M1115_09915 [Actinobacteria bacterium]|nr:hypothetical protein [Actinomycetota bacterium]